MVTEYRNANYETLWLNVSDVSCNTNRSLCDASVMLTGLPLAAAKVGGTALFPGTSCLSTCLHGKAQEALRGGSSSFPKLLIKNFFKLFWDISKVVLPTFNLRAGTLEQAARGATWANSRVARRSGSVWKSCSLALVVSAAESCLRSEQLQTSVGRRSPFVGPELRSHIHTVWRRNAQTCCIVWTGNDFSSRQRQPLKGPTEVKAGSLKSCWITTQWKHKNIKVSAITTIISQWRENKRWIKSQFKD